MRVKGFSLTLRTKAKSRFNPTGELKTVILRVSSGIRGARRPFKSLGIDLYPNEWDELTQSIRSNAKIRIGPSTYSAYEKRIEGIKSRLYHNYVALEKGERSVDQAFSDVLDMNAQDLMWPMVQEISSSKDEVRYFKDYCKVIGKVPEHMIWTYFTPNSFGVYVDHLRNERNVTESTITSYVKTLKKFFAAGQQKGLIGQNVSIAKNLTKGYSKAGGRKRFENLDVLNCIVRAENTTDLLACSFILLSMHFCGSDRVNWMRLKKGEFYDEDGHQFRSNGLRFVRYKRNKEEKTESIGNTYFPFSSWYIDALVDAFRFADKAMGNASANYINDFLIGSFTIEPSVETVKSWYNRRKINESLTRLNPESQRVVNHQNCRSTFEFYGAKAGIDEQTLAFMQGRSIRGSVSHYAVMESRLTQVAELHGEAMSKFKMNYLTSLLFFKAEQILKRSFIEVPGWSNIDDIMSDFENDPILK
jgi:hypothetical protein